MVVYNLTIKLHSNIEKEWLQWLQEEHVPEILATGCFKESKIFQLLEHDEDDEPTYIVQYFAESMDDYNRYINLHAAVFRKKSLEKWGDKFVAFRTAMQTVH